MPAAMHKTMKKNCLNCEKDMTGMQQLPRRKFCGNFCKYAFEKSPEQRIKAFWSFVNKDGAGGCWLWTGGTYNHGYGSFWWRGKKRAASRVSWEIAHSDPAAMQVLHRCDVPACVNPAHLFLGTIKDNMRDMILKGRRAYCALKPDQVREIRAALKTPSRGQQTKLAQQYGVGKCVINKLALGITYRHIPSR